MKFGQLLGASVAAITKFYGDGVHKQFYSLSLRVFLLSALGTLVISLIILAPQVLIEYGSFDLEAFLVSNAYSHAFDRIGTIAEGVSMVLVIIYGFYIVETRNDGSIATGKAFWNFLTGKAGGPFLLALGATITYNFVFFEPVFNPYDSGGLGQVSRLLTAGLEGINSWELWLYDLVEIIRWYLPATVTLLAVQKVLYKCFYWKPIAVSALLFFMLTAVYWAVDNLVETHIISVMRGTFPANILLAPLFKLGIIITANAYFLAGYGLCFSMPNEIEHD